MIPIWHFLASLVLFLVLYPYFGLISLLVFVGGWLIDLDHMLYYALEFKSLNYKKANKYFRTLKPGRKKVTNIFHTAEVWAVMFVLSFYNIYFLMISLGLFMHILMDFAYLIKAGKTKVKYHTLTEWFIDKVR